MSDTTPQVSEALVLKIRKLLAMANHAATPEHEAAAAAGMVQKLMTEYNIEIQQVEAAGTSQQPGGKREKKFHDRAAMYGYQRDLMSCVAENNFCKHWVDEVRVPHEKRAGDTRKAKRHFLLGRDINVRSVEMVYDYLIDTMDRLLPYQGMDKRGKDALLWLAGCTERLVQRLNEQRAKADAERKAEAQEQAARAKHPGAAPSGNALVLVDVYQNEEELNNDYLRGLEPGTTTRNRLEREAKERAIKARIAELQAQGMDSDDAWYIARYGSIPQYVLDERAAKAKANAVAVRAKDPKPETDAQRRKRQEKAERQQERWDQQSNRRRNKDYARRNTAAFQHGSKTGATIGLDPQVTKSNQGTLK